MKRVGLWAAIGIGLFITVGLLTVEPGYVEGKEHEPVCTLKTLKGTYRFAATGYNITSTGPQPLAIVEVINVNGDGTLNVPAVTLSVNGTILRFVDVGGSYTVNENCTGTITFVTEVNLDISIAPNGKEFYWIQTDADTVLAAVARKVSHDHTKCTPATLTSTYVFTATGYNIVSSVPQPKAIVESIDFNGDGTLTSLATVSVNGVLLGASFHGGSGSYTVNENCTGTITFADGPHFDIFIAPNGKELYLIQTNPNTVLAGVSRRVSHDDADHDHE